MSGSWPCVDFFCIIQFYINGVILPSLKIYGTLLLTAPKNPLRQFTRLTVGPALKCVSPRIGNWLTILHKKDATSMCLLPESKG